MITRAPAELKTLLGFIGDFVNMNENIYLQRSSLRLKFCVKEPRDWKVFGVGISLKRKPLRGSEMFHQNVFISQGHGIEGTKDGNESQFISNFFMVPWWENNQNGSLKD